MKKLVLIPFLLVAIACGSSDDNGDDTPDAAATPADADAPSADAAVAVQPEQVCQAVCEYFDACFQDDEPECVTECVEDVEDCSQEELEAFDACTDEECADFDSCVDEIPCLEE